MTFSYPFETEPLSNFFSVKSTAMLTKTGDFTLKKKKLEKSLFQAFGSVWAKNKVSKKRGDWGEQ